MMMTTLTPDSSVFFEFLGHRLATALFSHLFRIGYILQLNPLLNSESETIVQRPNGNSITTLLLLPSLSLKVFSIEKTPGVFSIMPKNQEETKSMSHSVILVTPRSGWKENLFYICVSIYNFLHMKVPLLIDARGHNFSGIYKHSRFSMAGWLSCLVSECIRGITEANMQCW